MILKAENLYFSYGSINVLKGLNISFERGKLYGIIGPNGCGKSTFIKNIYGYLKPDKGNIYVDNKNIHSMKHKDRAKIIAYVPQEIQTGFDYSVSDIVSMGRNPYHNGLESLTRNDITIIENAMKAADVYELRLKGINELSGGEKQSTIIARALAQDTDIILMDEPVSSLDINHQVEIMETVKKLTHSNKTVICVLHDLNLAAQYADEIALFHEGKVYSKGTPDQVLTEENISKVYKVNVIVEYNGTIGRKIIIPVSGKKGY